MGSIQFERDLWRALVLVKSGFSWITSSSWKPQKGGWLVDRMGGGWWDCGWVGMDWNGLGWNWMDWDGLRGNRMQNWQNWNHCWWWWQHWLDDVDGVAVGLWKHCCHRRYRALSSWLWGRCSSGWPNSCSCCWWRWCLRSSKHCQWFFLPCLPVSFIRNSIYLNPNQSTWSCIYLG